MDSTSFAPIDTGTLPRSLLFYSTPLFSISISFYLQQKWESDQLLDFSQLASPPSLSLHK
jgi:hypothetical protein